jgi:hypothetical protein
MQPVISRQQVRIATGSSDEEGCLLFADGHLVAVIVRLSEPSHGKLRGCWFLECGFGPWYSTPSPEPFADIGAAEQWLAERLESR